MKKSVPYSLRLAAVALCAALGLPAAAQEAPFTARDLTAEGLFTNNIEGPMVDRRGTLFVVNFGADGTIAQVAPDGACTLFVTLPAGSAANAIQFDRRGDMLLADFKGHHVLRVNSTTRRVTVHARDSRFNQPNDLAINRRNQLFASDPNWKEGTGQLWRVEANGRAVLLETGMGTTNGLELSPDERILYVNESVQRRIWRYDVDRRGRLSGKRLFARFEEGGLDGMKCDAEGNLYVARWGTGTVAVFSPDGRPLREIPLKGRKVSNLAFGGSDGRTVFVTLRDRGCLETFRVEVPGKRFKK